MRRKVANSSVRILIEPPRIDYSDLVAGPTLGPEDAPVTIIEYSDFQCPFCAKSEEVLTAIRKSYPSMVRLVYKHFPLSIH